MPKISSTFQIPSYARNEAYDFETTANSMQIFTELNRISEEIEACRLGSFQK